MKVKPIYDECTEFRDIAEKIIKKYPSEFGGIDSSLIKCYAVSNKERPDKKKMWTVSVIKSPVSEDVKTHRYFFEIYMTDWMELNDAQKSVFVAEALCSLPFDGEEKKITPDVQGYRRIFSTFGLDFMNDPNLPDIIKTNVTFKS